MKKALIVLIVIALFAVYFIGCSATQEVTETEITEQESTEAVESASSEEEQFFAVLAFGALDATPKQLSDSFLAKAEKLGWKTQVTNADQDPSKLISDVESVCELKPDVILCRGINDISMPQIIETCYAAEIPLILVSIGNDELQDKFLTLTNDPIPAAGQMMADYLIAWLDEDPTREANVGYVVGDYNLEFVLPRTEVPAAAIEDHPRGKNLVDAEGNWNAADAMSVTEDWIQKYPEMNAIVSSSDEMSIGVIQALQAAGKKPEDSIILSYDGLDIVYDYLKQGWLDATAALDLGKQTDVWVELCQKIESGETEDIEDITYMHSLYPLSTENIDGILSGEIPIEYYEY